MFRLLTYNILRGGHGRTGAIAAVINACAPDLVPLRQQLMAMVGRPVNIQASRDIVTRFRGDLLGQPYLTLFEKPDHLSLNDKPLA